MTTPYPSYKQSGHGWLGRVPTTWDVVRLGTCFDERREKVSDQDFAPLSVTMCGVVPQLETAAKTDDGGNRKLVRAGDFAINSRSDRKGSSGLSVHDGSVSLINTVLIPQARIDSDFCNWLLRSRDFQEEFYRWGQGIVADLWTTKFSQMKNINIPLPSIDEQKAIATFLDRETGKIDALVEEQKRLIELLKEKRQAVISHAVTKGLNPDAPMKDSGIEWLGEVPVHWEVQKLKYFITKFEQGWSPQCEAEPVSSSKQWGVLKVGCVNGGVFKPQENKTLPAELDPLPELGVRAGDLLISRANTLDLVGSAAVSEDNYPNLLICDKLYRARLHEDAASSYFLSFYLSSRVSRGQIELKASGASHSMQNISQSAILDHVIALPQIEEQNEVVGHLEGEIARLDALVQHSNQAIELLSERRAALISAAVTGKIDVRDLVEKEVA
ncbi:restriction endonuclease subunit S [Roseibium aggregatum]|uniref:restriction endonuclease subunit S n=1 Tax=Roseibium aggregatum TaxID=187304 RepID=UPI001A8FAC0F|nr:restriction endonuclease subunit S [Roseibium aggregatum]MBN8185059.1 restriction endonuclease subunit S [Roseibium aggregatum]